MGALDQAMPAVARALVGAFGTSVTIEITRTQGYDTATRGVSARPVTVKVPAVIGQYDTKGQTKAREFPVYIAAADMTEEPLPGDLITFGETRGRVKGVEVTYAGGASALYECRVAQ